MRHSIVAALALLGIVAGFARAEYAVIRVNLAQIGAVKPDPKAPPPPVEKTDPGDNGLTVVIFIEYEKGGSELLFGQGTPPVPSLKYRGARLYLDFDSDTKSVKGYRLLGVAKRYKEKYDALKRKNDRTPKDYLEVLEWAVGNGMIDETLKEKTLMSEFLALDAKADPKAAAAQKACRDLAALLAAQQKTSPKEDEAVAIWKDRLGCRSTSSESYPHYTMLYDSQTNKPGQEVFDRLDRLEKNFRTFYYYFALRGKVLPLPEKRLMALLVSDPKDFDQRHQAFDSVPRATDGFYARRDNLLVLSTSRLGLAADTLTKMSEERFKDGWDFKKLVAGKGGYPSTWSKIEWLKMTPEQQMAKYKELIQELITNQTLALVQQAMSEEAEQAAVSHEGTRQLLTAIGLLPRTVLLPEWVQSGLPSVFETPRSDPFTQAGAFWPTFGEPNWVYLTYYKIWEQSKPPSTWLEKTPAEALQAVLTDRYFMQANTAKEDVAVDETIRARTMAWALSYYLVQRHLDDLLSYGEELNALPRDLELDDQAKLMSFARAFKLTADDKPDVVDPRKFAAFAKDWQDYLSTKALPAPASLDDARKTLTERRPSLLGIKKE